MAVTTLSVHRLYFESQNEDTLNPQRVDEIRLLLEDSEDRGLTPVGVSTTWVFPEFTEAPRVPASDFVGFTDLPEVRLHCVPARADEYQRLLNVRERMYTTMAQTYPEISAWIVGYEPSFPFFDCSGEPLQLPQLVPFIVDTLESLQATLKSLQPNSTVIAHFLGASRFRIFIGDEVVQPRLMQNLILEEIQLRGRPASDYFDLLVSDLFPDLLLDRSEETENLTAPRDDRRLMSYSPQGDPGWVQKTMENFETDSDDLVEDYDYWDDVDTAVAIDEAINVSNVTPPEDQVAELKLPSTDPTLSLSGAKSNSEIDFVPDAEFKSSTYERNKWTAVADFFPVVAPVDPDESGVHMGVGIRVEDRTWGGTADQTRFMADIFGGEQDFSPCFVDMEHFPCAALQFTGNDVNNSSVGKTKLLHFDLDEEPFDFETHLYRTQIVEREVLHPISLTWELKWYMEAWDLTDTNDCIGTSLDIWEWTVENVYGVEIPTSLSESNLFFAWGAADSDDGEVDVERTGTSYWNY